MPTTADESASGPDAWQRFERAIDAALHTPPQHREAEPRAKSKAVPAKPMKENTAR
jgi:hypothetical protein